MQSLQQNFTMRVELRNMHRHSCLSMLLSTNAPTPYLVRKLRALAAILPPQDTQKNKAYIPEINSSIL